MSFKFEYKIIDNFFDKNDLDLILGSITEENKKRVNISSYIVKDSDLIEIKEKSKKLTFIEGSLQSKERDVPEYIQLDDKNKTAKLVRIPKFADIPYPTLMEPKLVIEYYSR